MAISTVQVILDGTTHTLSLNSDTQLYEKTINAPEKSSYNLDGGYYPVTVQAKDDAGNVTTVDYTSSTFGENLKLNVKEIVKPVTSITYPTENQTLSNNKPTITWTCTDDDSGVNPDTIGITIDSGNTITSGITKIPITGGYQCSYSISEELSDGNHTIYIDVSDNDGNSAVQRTVNFVVDTLPPNLSVTSPVNNLITNNSEIIISGVTTDDVSSEVFVTYKINDLSEQEIDVGSNGSFSTTVNIYSGTNTITVTATDSSGKSSSVTRIVTLDTQAPVIESIEISPNPVSTGELIKVTVMATD